MRNLTVEQAMLMDAYLIQKDSPLEFTGVKEPGSLQMCMAAPEATAFSEEVYPTLAEKAGILFINLVQKHCFHNANKRTAYMSLNVYLRLNGYDFHLDTEDAVAFVLMVANWNADFDTLKAATVAVIEENMQQRKE